MDTCLSYKNSSTTKVSEEVNRKLPARNTMVQLLALYTDFERQNAQRYYSQTDDHSACSTIG